MNNQHRKTCVRYDVPGDVHFLTFSCFQRMPLLDRDRTRQWMIDALARSRSRKQFELWAYVIMPEHVHLLINPLASTKISSILKRLKQSVSKRAIHWLKQYSPEYLPQILDAQPNGEKSYRFWQRGGGYDRNLRSVRDVHEKINYIHENPVRRGLVERPEQWRWSSATASMSGNKGEIPIPIDREKVPPLSNQDDRIDSHLM